MSPLDHFNFRIETHLAAIYGKGDYSALVGHHSRSWLRLEKKGWAIRFQLFTSYPIFLGLQTMVLRLLTTTRSILI